MRTTALVGLAVGVFGASLAARGLLLLLGRGRPHRGPRPALVLAGPYVRQRNPILAGTLLALAGAALACGSRLALLATVALAGVAHLWVTRVEEPRLQRRFGDAYTAYLRSVPRWLPRPRRDDD